MSVEVTPASGAGTAAATMTGFPPEAIAFFAGLEADNSRSYWTAHRAVFDRAVAAPMRALLDMLFGDFHVFRMLRDLRFTPDRSPYKTMYGAAADSGGAVRYVHLDARGLTVVCGAYVLAGEQLTRYRHAVADPDTGAELDHALAALRAARLEIGSGGPAPLTGAPRGFARDHPRIELLRSKGLIGSTRVDDERLRDLDTLRDTVLGVFAAGAPLNNWIRGHVGPGRPRTRP